MLIFYHKEQDANILPQKKNTTENWMLYLTSKNWMQIFYLKELDANTVYYHKNLDANILPQKNPKKLDANILPQRTECIFYKKELDADILQRTEG